MSKPSEDIDQSAYVTGKEKVARLFGGKVRGHAERGRDRLPPGQRLVSGFPVLDLGIRPHPDRIPKWTLTVDGAVENPMTWNLEELKKLPNHTQVKDFHCVTRWSRYDLEWKGVLLTTLADIVKPSDSVGFVIFHCFDGYTTNVSVQDALTNEGMVAWEVEEDDLSIEHGGPIRGLIPHLYGWKSAKFLQRIEFVEEDEPGFWEVRGYHNHGDPWDEERYSD